MVGCGSRYATFQDSRWLAYNVPDSVNFNNIIRVACDFNGNVWLANRKSVISYDGMSWIKYPFPDSWTYIQVIEVDNNGILWAGGLEGIGYLHGDSWKIFNKTNSIMAPESVIDIAFDGSNGVWVTTFGNGLAYLAD